MRVRLRAVTALVPWYIDEPMEFDSRATDCDNLSEFAGRACYLSWHKPNPATADNEGYLRHINEVGHHSVEEHASASFWIEGVSRSLLTELERHRHFSYSVVSQRYVDAGEMKPVHPPLFNDHLNDMLDTLSEDAMDFYDEAVLTLRSAGYSIKEARGAARAFLPEATETKILLTGNMRAYRDFIPKRWGKQADVEIRNLALELLFQLKVWAPSTFADLIPPEDE